MFTVGLSLIERGFMNRNEEGHYHFVLSDMVDLVAQYGYSKVINDLDSRIADVVNRLVEEKVICSDTK
jgi:hypothetical protein